MHDAFVKQGVQVLSMSTDSVFVHKMWVDHELSKMVTAGTVPFPMLSDAAGRVGGIYGVYDRDAGVDVRGRFLIDPDGVVQGFEVLSPPVGRNVGETLRQIQAFQLVRASGGTQATPSGWRPGKPVLTPGPALVGRVWSQWQVGLAKDD
jgi:peroxiredoxin (alkyl hydroperoxide reductase subunit C)